MTQPRHGDAGHADRWPKPVQLKRPGGWKEVSPRPRWSPNSQGMRVLPRAIFAGFMVSARLITVAGGRIFWVWGGKNYRPAFPRSRHPPSGEEARRRGGGGQRTTGRASE